MAACLKVDIFVDDTFCKTSALTCPFFIDHPKREYSCKIFGIIEPSKGRHRDCFSFNNKTLYYQTEQENHQKMSQTRKYTGSNMQFMEHSETLPSADFDSTQNED